MIPVRQVAVTSKDGSMDPFGTLIVSLGTLLVLDFAALKLGASSRQRPRARASSRQR